MTVLADYADKYETVSVQREDGILQVTFHSGDGSLLWGEAAHRELGYALPTSERTRTTRLSYSRATETTTAPISNPTAPRGECLKTGTRLTGKARGY